MPLSHSTVKYHLSPAAWPPAAASAGSGACGLAALRLAPGSSGCPAAGRLLPPFAAAAFVFGAGAGALPAAGPKAMLRLAKVGTSFGRSWGAASTHQYLNEGLLQRKIWHSTV